MGNENAPAPLICHGVLEGETAHEPCGNNGLGTTTLFIYLLREVVQSLS